ncbi:ethanolamine ammonia-lyase subunit EutB, partial [Escherichia coli]|uniref:ethanolamine ammonia-lyase subunit EutB n=1 Tax=Escherichia coli TaxID=562 RepID=UPI0013269CC1|nr:ethanolamine ammonia lyase large subunit [Escherichia coli]
IMLNYQTTSFHDALYARRVLGLKPAPEFDTWLAKMEILKNNETFTLNHQIPKAFRQSVQNIIGDY